MLYQFYILNKLGFVYMSFLPPPALLTTNRPTRLKGAGVSIDANLESLILLDETNRSSIFGSGCPPPHLPNWLFSLPYVTRTECTPYTRWNVPPFFQSMTPSTRTIRVASACTGRRSPEPKWLFSTLQITRTELRTIRWIGPHPFHKISQHVKSKPKLHPKLHSNFSSLKLISRKEERTTSSSVESS